MGHTCEFTRSHINSLHSNHLKELERIWIIIYLDNSQNLLSWNYIFCMDVRIIISFNTWIWIYKLKVRPSISIEEPTVSFKKLFFLHGREKHCHSIWILNKFKLWGFVWKKVSLFDIINVLYSISLLSGLKTFLYRPRINLV